MSAARSTEVARLSRLVDGLLELARAERSSAGTESIELAAVVDGRVDAWSALAAERTVDLVTELDAGLVVRSAPGRLEQVLDNLLANALEVAPPQSEVRVDRQAPAGPRSSSRCSTRARG